MTKFSIYYGTFKIGEVAAVHKVFLSIFEKEKENKYNMGYSPFR